MRKFKQWCAGLTTLYLSALLFYAIIMLPADIFVEMMNRTGLSFLAPFVLFIILLFFFIFVPYFYMELIKEIKIRLKEETEEEEISCGER